MLGDGLGDGVSGSLSRQSAGVNKRRAACFNTRQRQGIGRICWLSPIKFIGIRCERQIKVNSHTRNHSSSSDTPISEVGELAAGFNDGAAFRRAGGVVSIKNS